jgi:hypothetical protein
MIANRSLGRAELIAKAIQDAGHQVTSPWVLGPIEHSKPTVVDVFQRDKKGAEECDILVADVSEPSIGVGMEIMAAYKMGRRIILVSKKGRVMSRMLQHMDKKETVEFEEDEELYASLRRIL